MPIYTAAFVTIQTDATLEQLVAEARSDWADRYKDAPTHVITPVGLTDQAVVAGLIVVQAQQMHSIVGVGIVVEAPK